MYSLNNHSIHVSTYSVTLTVQINGPRTAWDFNVVEKSSFDDPGITSTYHKSTNTVRPQYH